MVLQNYDKETSINKQQKRIFYKLLFYIFYILFFLFMKYFVLVFFIFFNYLYFKNYFFHIA